MAHAVQDDEQRHVLHWVMEHKRNDIVWREQVEKRIELMKSDETGYQDWVGWEDYVREKVDSGILKSECLSIMEDAGGKGKSKQSDGVGKGKLKHSTCFLEPRISPAKTNKKKRCMVHGFKEEMEKKTAIKGSGNILDGIVCEGINDNGCGKEFVFKEGEASCQEKACVVCTNNPAFGGVMIAFWFCAMVAMPSIVK